MVDLPFKMPNSYQPTFRVLTIMSIGSFGNFHYFEKDKFSCVLVIQEVSTNSSLGGSTNHTWFDLVIKEIIWWYFLSLLKLRNVIILCSFFTKTAPPILMKLCMQLGYDCLKKVRPLAPLVIAPFKRKAAALDLRVYVKAMPTIEITPYLSNYLPISSIYGQNCIDVVYLPFRHFATISAISKCFC